MVNPAFFAMKTLRILALSTVTLPFALFGAPFSNGSFEQPALRRQTHHPAAAIERAPVAAVAVDRAAVGTIGLAGELREHAAVGNAAGVKVEGGLMVRGTDGTSARATVSYDGIGSDDLNAWGGQLWLSVPLN